MLKECAEQGVHILFHIDNVPFKTGKPSLDSLDAFRESRLSGFNTVIHLEDAFVEPEFCLTDNKV